MTRAEAAGLRYVLLDIDDTITTGGKLSSAAYDSLWRLHDGGLKVVPVTGRPGGWCDLIAREWPVDGVIGENGALVFWEAPGKEGRVLRRHFHPRAVPNDHPGLLRIRDRALAEVPGLRVAKDQFARLFDLALDFAEEEPALPLDQARRVRDIALEEGARAKVSSIHVNVWIGDYDKLSMAEWFLGNCFGWRPGPGDREVVFAGDSPNDEPMFARFPLTCGVANIRRYEGLIRHRPLFAASKESGEGFAEIAAALLERRG
jgi:HAD superfamily hydrolase (TIGR01484 family)